MLRLGHLTLPHMHAQRYRASSACNAWAMRICITKYVDMIICPPHFTGYCTPTLLPTCQLIYRNVMLKKASRLLSIFTGISYTETETLLEIPSHCNIYYKYT